MTHKRGLGRTLRDCIVWLFTGRVPHECGWLVIASHRIQSRNATGPHCYTEALTRCEGCGDHCVMYLEGHWTHDELRIRLEQPTEVVERFLRGEGIS